MRNIGLFLFIAMLSIPAQAAPAEGTIVRLKDPKQAIQYELQNGVTLKAISPQIGLYHAVSNGAPKALTKSLAFGKAASAVYSVPNHKVTLRQSISKVTNDPLIDQQWNMGLDAENVGINAVGAWQDFGSRNYDKSFNEVVIAVVDGGFDTNHPDLLYNRWTNWGEIPGNGIDDDGNGYIDDINGWDVSTNTGKIASADHGTHVAGIIGARGNNSRGIVGVNWRARIMYVSSGDLGDTATTMSAYAYILKQKQIWLESKGKKGANVVAINSSFGIDGVKCSEPQFAVWNDMMNELGKSGILSIAATSNFEVNIDKNGDIPTSCDSEFLISVTNNNRDGSKATGKEWDTISNPKFENLGAGFGKVSIDLAAPGDQILSTAERTDALAAQLYTAQSGTSFSTPHVAGAVGYLHGVATIAFNKSYMADPAGAALQIKKAMLSTVTPVAALSELTKSGGVLNLHEASLALQTSSLLVAHAQ